VAFSADGHTLASNADGTIQLWDVTDPAHPRPLGRPLTGRTAGIGSVAFSPSVVFSPRGHTLAGNGSNGGPFRLWDVTDPARPRPLGQPFTGSAASVYSVAFSPGGYMLASGSIDGHNPALESERPVRNPTDLCQGRGPHAPAVEPVHSRAAVPAVLRPLAPPGA
jgi:WD40 repeat protein